jgi:hypothetical protein
MTPAQWDRLKTVFQGALDQPPASRRAWLARACGDDDDVRREAEALLESHETAGEFLEKPPEVDPSDVQLLVPGTRVGPYRILEEIGHGGMGVVYLAEDTRLGRRVALKSLPAAIGASPELRERLRREARAAATVSHPAVATVFALEEIDDQLFIASEYVAGGTLRELIDAGPVEPGRAAAIAGDVARALCAAHEAGVIHRDLKPENVLLTPSGGVKVVDFGIALVEGPAGTRLTRSGAALGTPAYMAPEQLLGRMVDSRADMYSFGVLVREMLTGRHPLAASTAAPPTPQAHSGRSGRLMRVALRCMHADPSERYASCGELLRELEPAAEGGAWAGSPVPVASRRGLSPLWWWQFHQAATALVYWLMAAAAWRGRELIGGVPGRIFFFVILASVIVAANLRLHLWFASRFYPAEHRWARRRVRRWIAAADWVFAPALLSGGLLIGDENAPLAVLYISVAIGAAVAFLLIEPVTARAAFKSPPTV